MDTGMGLEGARAAEGMGLGCLVATPGTGVGKGVVRVLALGLMVEEGLRVPLLLGGWDGPTTLPRFRVSATAEADGRAEEGVKAVGRAVVGAAAAEEELVGGALVGRREERNCCAMSCCCC